MPDLLNPEAVPGHNDAPDFAQMETERLSRDYAELLDTASTLLAEAAALPERVEDDAMALTFGAVVKRIRDLDKRMESHREAEKAPHLRASNAIDQFFFHERDRLGRRAPRDRPGAADILNARIGDHQQRKLAAERERLRLEAEERARVAREAAAEQRRRDDEARQARDAAERARTERTRHERQQEATQAAQVASAAAVEAQVTAGAATTARVDTLAKAADLVRTRGGEGVTLTMATEAYAIVTDPAALNKEKLWAFITLDAKEKALRAWAKTTGHTEQMTGAEIGHRPRSVVR